MTSPLWLHRYALLTVSLTLFLLVAGALVTSTGSGLAVPDWPLSFGQYFPEMKGGVFYEHGHRMVAGTVGIATVLLALFLAFFEPRRWVKWMGGVMVLVVCTQAILGGITVIYRLPTAVSVAHACLAQIFFSLTILMAFWTSPGWAKRGSQGISSNVKLMALLLTIALFLQLLMGASMRHVGAGLAIPDFPLSFGRVIPEFHSFAIAIHFAHRAGALAVVLISAFLFWAIFSQKEMASGLVMWLGGLLSLLAVQVVLGGLTIWLRRPVWLTATHLAVGALCLGVSVLITFKSWASDRPST